MSAYSSTNDELQGESVSGPTLVIIGASLAGVRAAEGARRDGFGGDIVLVGEEDCLPYDRPPLTKQVLAAGNDFDGRPLRSETTLRDELGLTIHLGVRATGVDPSARVVSTTSGDLDFDALVIATGCRARPAPPNLAGSAVHTIRTATDARNLRLDLDRASSVAIVGAGFIGCEVASAASVRGLDVTLIEAASAPLVRVVGSEASEGFTQLHAAHGVRLKTGTTVDGLEMRPTQSELVLSDGDRVVADVVVVAIGTLPNTEWLTGSGLDLSDGIVCRSDLGVGISGIAAAGDVCQWTDPRWGGRSSRREHWTNAAEQGPHAARTALNSDHHEPFSSIPYFWSEIHGHRVQLIGRTDGTESLTLGSLDAGDYMTLYRNEDQLHGVLTVGPTAHTAKFRTLLAEAGSWSNALETAVSMLP